MDSVAVWVSAVVAAFGVVSAGSGWVIAYFVRRMDKRLDGLEVAASDTRERLARLEQAVYDWNGQDRRRH